MASDIERLLLTPAQIADACARLGGEIGSRLSGRDVTAVCILKGSSLFFADLMRCVDMPVAFDFVRASSYGSAAESSGDVSVSHGGVCVCGKTVLLVEDIVDTGRTISKVKSHMLDLGAKEVFVAALLDKPSRRVADFSADFVGFEIPDEFVVGYGLDYNEKYRNLPYIGILKRNAYEK